MRALAPCFDRVRSLATLVASAAIPLCGLPLCGCVEHLHIHYHAADGRLGTTFDVSSSGDQMSVESEAKDDLDDLLEQLDGK